MPYAIVQTSIAKPSEDQLRKAFQQVSWLTDLDAALMARDAYGIIVDNLSYARAEAISAALQTFGVAHCMIDQSAMPELGARKQLRRMECRPEGPVLYDPLGRAIPGSWSDVRLVAAGLVGMRKIQRREKQRVVHRATGWHGGAAPVVVTDIVEKQIGVDKLVMELYMGDRFSRFRVVADKFHYNYLGDRQRLAAAENFALLVQDITAGAPQAAFSQGVQSLADDQVTTFAYPTEHAFSEEIKWLRWMRSQNSR